MSQTNDHTVMNFRGRKSIKYWELTKANRNERKETYVSAISQFGKKKGKNQREDRWLTTHIQLNVDPVTGSNMANGSYRKVVVADLSGWGDQSLLQMVC